MLALSRKKNESIMIGDDIEITIVDVQADQVKLAIGAPRNVPVHRKEIYLQIQQENKAAAKISDKSIEELKGLMK
ncbi:MAG: carbon storage regulator [Clostridiales bacterium GWE2_32_10]|nr:MAG: carbon storage regulator [Clostridiales bacterium GWE2_32_10]HBY21046.1 carbon storage regulator [Clostridiales bacterium]